MAHVVLFIQTVPVTLCETKLDRQVLQNIIGPGIINVYNTITIPWSTDGPCSLNDELHKKFGVQRVKRKEKRIAETDDWNVLVTRKRTLLIFSFYNKIAKEEECFWKKVFCKIMFSILLIYCCHSMLILLLLLSSFFPKWRFYRSSFKNNISFKLPHRIPSEHRSRLHLLLQRKFIIS